MLTFHYFLGRYLLYFSAGRVELIVVEYMGMIPLFYELPVGMFFTYADLYYEFSVPMNSFWAAFGTSNKQWRCISLTIIISADMGLMPKPGSMCIMVLRIVTVGIIVQQCLEKTNQPKCPSWTRLHLGICEQVCIVSVTRSAWVLANG